MLTTILDFVLKATRQLFFAALLVGFVLYILPADVVLELGFVSPNAARWTGFIIQVASIGVLSWPLLDRLWISGRKQAEVFQRQSSTRSVAKRLSPPAQELLAYMIFMAQEHLCFPMNDAACLELERAGLLKRATTRRNIASFHWTQSLKSWLSSDHAWAIAQLKLEEDRLELIANAEAEQVRNFSDRF